MTEHWPLDIAMEVIGELYENSFSIIIRMKSLSDVFKRDQEEVSWKQCIDNCFQVGRSSLRVGENEIRAE